MTEILRLPDGRGLAYAEYGDPDGAPVFFSRARRARG